METLGLCLSCGVLAWMAAMTLCDAGRATSLGRLPHRLCTRLARTGVARTLDGWVAWREVVAWLGYRHAGLEPEGTLLAALLASVPLGALLSRSLVGAAVLPTFCLGAVAVQAGRLRRQRELEVVEEVPEVFRALAVALGAGRTLRQAVEYVGSNVQGPMGRSFTRAALRLQAGATVHQALRGVADEVQGPGVELMVTALEIAQRTGSPLEELFSNAATYVERGGALRREMTVKTAQARLSVRIVCALPAAIVGLLAMVSPDFRAGVASRAGLVCLTLATAMDVCAVLIIRRMAKGVM